MSGAQHTPGPWEYGARDDGFEMSCLCTIHNVPLITHESGVARPWAYVSGPKKCFEIDEAENEANGRLMAAAPDLLQALREAVDIVVAQAKMPAGTVERLLTASAKAEGRS